MRIRQIALVAADLERTLADLCDVFALEVGYRDPGVGVFGLENGVMPVGEQFLEVVSPRQEGTSAGRYLDRRRGDGGYMVILQTQDLDSRRRRLADEHVRVAWEIAFDDIATIHLHPRDTGGAIVSIDEARPRESWRWAGPSWREHVSTRRVTRIRGVEIQSDDPDALRKRWATIFDLENANDASSSLVLDDGGHISFCYASDGRGEGIRSVVFETSHTAEILDAARAHGFALEEDCISIAGTRFVLA